MVSPFFLPQPSLLRGHTCVLQRIQRVEVVGKLILRRLAQALGQPGAILQPPLIFIQLNRLQPCQRLLGPCNIRFFPGHMRDTYQNPTKLWYQMLNALAGHTMYQQWRAAYDPENAGSTPLPRLCESACLVLHPCRVQSDRYSLEMKADFHFEWKACCLRACLRDQAYRQSFHVLLEEK